MTIACDEPVAVRRRTQIPDVFRRMPIELLCRYAQHGVIGAKQELRHRRAEEAMTKGKDGS